jgi:coenzyme PQQ precursor peptide PqqA
MRPTWLWPLPARDRRWEVTPMTWETPTFVEVKMDAEINSYQDDFDREDNGI